MWPNQVQRPQIVNGVGDAESDLELYREVLTQFMLEGQNKTRVDWTLERFAAAKPAPISQPGDGGYSPSAIREHLQSRKRALADLQVEQDALCAALMQVLERITEIESEVESQAEGAAIDARKVDEALTEAEKLLDSALLASAAADEIDSINSEVAEQLKQYRGQMEPAAYASAFHRAVVKRLRERFALPRLGLFTL